MKLSATAKEAVANGQAKISQEAGAQARAGAIQTTERYLGCKQKLRIAVNDRLGIEPGAVESGGLDTGRRQGGCFRPPWATTRYLPIRHDGLGAVVELSDTNRAR